MLINNVLNGNAVVKSEYFKIDCGITSAVYIGRIH